MLKAERHGIRLRLLKAAVIRCSGDHQAVIRLMRRCGSGWETVEEVGDQLPATMVTNSEVVDLRVKQDGMEERMRFGVPNLHQLTV